MTVPRVRDSSKVSGRVSSRVKVSTIVNNTYTQTYIQTYTHTHTHRDRERERESIGDVLKCPCSILIGFPLELWILYIPISPVSPIG